MIFLQHPNPDVHRTYDNLTNINVVNAENINNISNNNNNFRQNPLAYSTEVSGSSFNIKLLAVTMKVL